LDFPEDGDLDIMRNLYIYMPTCTTLNPRTMGPWALPQLIKDLTGTAKTACIVLEAIFLFENQSNEHGAESRLNN